MRKLLYMAVAAALLLPACGKKVEKGEETEAEIEAAMIEGREAARVFVNTEWKDTMELQYRLLQARTRSSKYDMAKKPQSKAAFDSAFVSTIRTVRPDVAAELDKAEARPKQ